MYDRAGHDCLIQQIGCANIFSGVKLRRGADLAEQTVVLNEKTIAIVQQVIELTRPLREYLKSVGDSAWRLLFLSCGRGFAYPRALKISELTSSALRLEHTASQMSQICGLSIQVAELTARRFSLPRLRASVAVSAYIKKPDIGTLSRSLGHANIDAKLLRSYLPEALLDFFQERWIRLFQCGLLCEALKDSKWRLDNVTQDKLADLVKERFGTSNYALIDTESLAAYMAMQIEQGMIVEPHFHESLGGKNYRILVHFRGSK